VTSEPTVLVVDDESDIVYLLVEVLENQGLGVVSAGNGQQALEMLHRHSSLKLVVSDVRMPVLDGPGLRARFDQSFSGREMTWIALTTPGIEDGDIPGFDVTFYKPFNFSALARLVREHLDQK
jgi:CheY-like chemotaxis protein